MICSKCGNDYSLKVWRVHRYRCNGVEELPVVDESPVKQKEKAVDLDEMSKNELLEYADEHGIEVDRRYGAHKLREVISYGDAGID
jgi:hypothetical protein